MLGRYAWLARLADKVRAEHAGTEGEYVAYCPLSMGFLDRAGVAAEDFDRLIAQDAADAGLVAFFDQHVSDKNREAANRLEDAEEGRH